MRNGWSYLAPVVFVLIAACNRTHSSHMPDAPAEADAGVDAK
jgi:hypothetical protein